MSQTASPSPRTHSAIDQIAEDYFDASIAMSPMLATYLGVPGSEGLLDEAGIQGVRDTVNLAQSTVGLLEDAVSGGELDEVDIVTAAALRDQLMVSVQINEGVLAGTFAMPLNVLGSAVQEVRDVFDLMATQTPQQWGWVLDRLRAVPGALELYAEALRYSAERGAIAPRRQVLSTAAQCIAQSHSESSTYSGLIAGATTIPDDLRADLEGAASDANTAFGQLAAMMTEELLDQAPSSDAAGVERYRLLSHSFLGTDVDLAETYRWGQEELARITGMMQDCAEQIRPGASVKEAVKILDADEKYQLTSKDALKKWMQNAADEAIAALSDTHFDIPEPIRRIECMIAPSQTGIIYYTGPSEDFARPGQMWWSVPPNVESFTTWRELTTVYHEGVPGHHLQIAQTTLRKDTLNRWRRLGSWSSGHGEGWALYSEWLMADLGYLDDPGMRMGLLDAQSLRAARVVIDVGVHCEFEAPPEVGGGQWTYDKAWEFLNNHVNMDEATVRFELDRYLGYPGQAPSYKIGERFWLELRDEVKAREGEAFDLSAFHRRALDVGGLGLDALRLAVLGQQ